MKKNEYVPDYLQNGRIDKTQKTDTFCFILFLAIQFITLIITVIAMIRGDPDKLYNPYDPDHQPCGSGERQDFPYIYFPVPGNETLWITVCVKECPQKTMVNGNIDCYPNSIVKKCSVDFSPQDAALRFLIYQSLPYSGNICVPVINKYFEAVSQILKTQTLLILIDDLKKSIWLITFSGIFSLILGYFMIHLAKKYPLQASYSYIVFSVTICILISCFFFFKYKGLISNNQINSNEVVSQSSKIKNIINNNLIDPVRYLQMGIIFSILACGLIFLGYSRFQKIKQSCNIIYVSAKYIEQKPEVLFIPIIMFSVSCIYFIVCLSTLINLYSFGKITDTFHSLPFNMFIPDQSIKKYIFIQLFGLIWTMLFFSSSIDFIVSSSCSIWYFNIKQWNQKTKNIAIKCIEEFIRFHIGTVAFAAIILSLFRWIRDLLIVFELHNPRNKQNNVLNQVFQNFFLYITENSFVYVFLCGTNFWDSSVKVQKLICIDKSDRDNIERISGFGEVFQSSGIICICFITTMISAIVLQTAYYQENLNSPIAPILCIMIFSFSIGKYTMGMIGAAADSILVLIQIDEQLNGGIALSIPQQLEELFNKKFQKQIKPEFGELNDYDSNQAYKKEEIQAQSPDLKKENISTQRQSKETIPNQTQIKEGITDSLCRKKELSNQIQDKQNFVVEINNKEQKTIKSQYNQEITIQAHQKQQDNFHQIKEIIQRQPSIKQDQTQHYQKILMKNSTNSINKILSESQKIEQKEESKIIKNLIKDIVPTNSQNLKNIVMTQTHCSPLSQSRQEEPFEYNIHNTLKKKYKNQRQQQKAKEIFSLPLK